MTSKLVIVGAGGLGREVAGIALAVNTLEQRWSEIGFVDDTPLLQNQEINGCRVIGNIAWLEAEAKVCTREASFELVFAIGDPIKRRRLVQQLAPLVRSCARVIHPSAYVGPAVQVGEGSVVFPGTTMTSNVTVGAHVVLYAGSTIAHDVTIGDYAHISQGCHLAGGCAIEEGVFLGASTTVRDKVKVGAWSVVGMNAAVLDDLPPSIVAYGIPARVRGARDQATRIFRGKGT